MLSYPTLIVSEAGEHTDKAFRAQVDQINALQAQLDKLRAEFTAAVKGIPSLQQLAKDLQLGGANPLNLTGLPGSPAQPLGSSTAPAHQFATGIVAGSGTTPSTLTYGQPSAADLTNGTTGSGSVVLATSPVVATPTITGTAPTVAAGQLGLGSTSAAHATAGGIEALPATVLGYLVFNIAGATIHVPYYL